MLGQEHKKLITRALYLLAFLTSVHYAFVAYINSSYLENFITAKNLGLLYALAAILTIVTIPSLSKLLRRFGEYKTVLSILCIDFAAVLALAAISSPVLSSTIPFQVSDGTFLVDNLSLIAPWIPAIAILSFLVFQISLVLNRILLDIYLEEFSKNSETGSNRGRSLTAMNLAFVFSPFIVGKIVTGTNDGFWKIYLISALFMLVSIAIVVSRLRSVKDVEYHTPPFLQTARRVIKNKNIFNIYLSSFLLEFFYSWMVIYTPIYLFNQVGFNWGEIGTIFSIMLTAFVILEMPLGKIADKYIGEKEILTAGFIIIAISTALLAFISSKSLIIWSLALFATRVGASAIEVMNDTYFFKKVRASDTDTISFFRNASPVAYVIGPTLASATLYFTDYKSLFLILGAIMLLGVKFSLAIEDTL